MKKGNIRQLFMMMMVVLSAAFLIACGTKEEFVSFDVSEIKTELAYGEELDLSPLTISQKFGEDEAKIYAWDKFNYNVNYGTYTPTTSGEHTIKLSYKKFEETFTVTVALRQEDGFEVDTSLIGNGNNTVNINSNINWDDLIVNAVFKDGGKVLLSKDEYTIDYSALNMAAYGTYEVRVNYKNYPTVAIDFTVVGETQVIDGKFIVYSHANYTIAGATDITLENEETNQIIVVEDFVINELPAGVYKLRYLNASNEPRERDLVSVNYLQIFGAGNHIEARRNAINSNQYLNQQIETYQIGVENTFIFDLKLIGVSNNQVEGTTSLLKYEFEKFNTTTQNFEAIEVEEIATVSGESFVFKAEYVGETFKVTVSPRYQQGLTPTVYQFKLTTGVNVFNHEQLKEAFGDLNVSSIILHREIVATLAPEQFNPDGTVKNYHLEDLATYVETDSNGKLVKNESGNVYIRYSRNINNNQLTVNGNYFTVNATQIKLLSTNKNGYPNQPGKLGIVKETDIVNSQSSIFLSSLKPSDAGQKIADAVNNGTSREDFNQILSNKVTFKNITVLGNTKAPVGDMTEAEIAEMVYKNSGGHALIRADHDMEVNNAVLKFSVIAVFMTEHGTDAKLDFVKIDESWANSIYGYAASNLSVSNSFIGISGGSSVWFEDTSEKEGIASPSFEIDNATIIDNFVSGTEAWFEAYGLSEVAVQIKSQLEAGVQMASGGNKTIIQERTNPSTGLKFEVFNFTVALVQVNDNKKSKVFSDKPKFTVGNHTIERSVAELGMDPRNTPDGFVFPVGQFSSLTNFMGLVNSLAGDYGQNAGNVAIYTAFNDPSATMIEAVISPPAPLDYFNSITMIMNFYNK